MTKLIYLSGKYSGDVERNVRIARDIAVTLWDEGYYVLCPHTNTALFERDCKQATYDAFLEGDLRMIDGVDALVMIPGWEESRGALIEKTYAEKRSIPVYLWPNTPPLDSPPETILQEAQRLVYGARQGSYGHPLDDFSRTAKIWSAVLGIDVTAEQVALCMVGVKISRECNGHRRDNLVDGAGYMATLELVVAEREKRRRGSG